jgi:hypothetical protein
MQQRNILCSMSLALTVTMQISSAEFSYAISVDTFAFDT